MLNGKIMVNLTMIKGASVFVYLQPNNFNTEFYDTHGIIENNMAY